MRRLLQSWRLFWVLAAVVSAAIALKLPAVDLRTRSGLLSMIHHSVRCALPFFVIAFSASSLAVLLPGPLTRWLLANRRYFGLTFALGMAWHFSFIAVLASRGFGFTFLLTTLDLIGAGFLLAMTVTSFPQLSRWLSAAGWRRLHKTGAYVIWGLATYIYVLSFPTAHGVKEHLPLLGLLGAWLLRVAAWAWVRRPRRGTARAA